MTAEQQLERSVLENKERDELHAIAQAMAIKTTSRTKKADIIDQILQATGVISAPSETGNGNAHGSDDTKARASARGRGRAENANGADDSAEGATTVTEAPPT